MMSFCTGCGAGSLSPQDASRPIAITKAAGRNIGLSFVAAERVASDLGSRPALLQHCGDLVGIDAIDQRNKDGVVAGNRSRHLVQTGSIERIGDQCVNIAKTIPLTGYEPPVRAEILERVLRMGRAARTEVTQSKAAFANRDVELAEDLVRQDREINALNREIFKLAIDVGTDPDTREWAMHMAMVARAIERIGDNAVDVGEQTAFVVTGLFREFSDSSHPNPLR